MATALIHFELKHRRVWMIGSLAVVWALWLGSFAWFRAYVDNQVATSVLLAISASITGIGRQGVDLIGVRLFASSMAVVATTRVNCNGFAECVNVYEYLVPILGIYCTVLMGFVAIPVNMLWNRGVGSLRPELAWHRFADLKRWQMVALAVIAVVALFAYYLSLGIPAY